MFQCLSLGSISHWVVATLASFDNQFITPVSTLAHSLPACSLEQETPSDSTVLVTTSKWVEACILLQPCIQDFPDLTESTVSGTEK